jgi:hypothetical protein
VVKRAPNELERAVGEHEVPILTLLFASVGPGVAWGIHFNLVYFLNALFCTTGRSGGAIATYAATALFAAVSLAAGWVAWRKWRMLGNDMQVDDAIGKPSGRTSILLFIGMASSVLFTLFIITEGLVPLFVRPCSLAT